MLHATIQDMILSFRDLALNLLAVLGAKNDEHLLKTAQKIVHKDKYT